MKRIIICDDHSVVYAGLKLILSDHLPNYKVDYASTEREMWQMIRQHDYALLIQDINMNESNIHSAITNVLSYRQSQRILILSMESNVALVKRYLQLGVKGYLSKEASVDEIMNAIKKVLDDGIYFNQNLVNSLVDDIFHKRSENPFDKLSRREFEVMQFLVKGHSLQTIGQILSLHPSTVGTHKSKIFEKTGTDNVIQLAELYQLYQKTQPDELMSF